MTFYLNDFYSNKYLNPITPPQLNANLGLNLNTNVLSSSTSVLSNNLLPSSNNNQNIVRTYYINNNDNNNNLPTNNFQVSKSLIYNDGNNANQLLQQYQDPLVMIKKKQERVFLNDNSNNNNFSSSNSNCSLSKFYNGSCVLQKKSLITNSLDESLQQNKLVNFYSIVNNDRNSSNIQQVLPKEKKIKIYLRNNNSYGNNNDSSSDDELEQNNKKIRIYLRNNNSYGNNNDKDSSSDDELKQNNKKILQLQEENNLLKQRIELEEKEKNMYLSPESTKKSSNFVMKGSKNGLYYYNNHDNKVYLNQGEKILCNDGKLPGASGVCNILAKKI